MSERYRFPRLVVRYMAAVYETFELDPGRSPLKVAGVPFFIDPELHEERILAQALSFSMTRHLHCCVLFGPEDCHYCKPEGTVVSNAPAPGMRKGRTSIGDLLSTGEK